MSRAFCTLSLAVVMVGGCAHKQETKAEAPTAPAPAPAAAATPAPGLGGEDLR